MKIVIIEDEAPAARRIQKLVKEIDKNITVDSLLDSIESAVSWFSNHAQPDLILMDIELADGQSFEIFNQVKITAPVIFTTAYDEFALKAFKVNSIDYLLKPIDKDALEAAITKFKNLKNGYGNHTTEYNLESLLKSLSKPQEYKSRFLIKIGDKLFPVAIEDIAYFMSEDKFTYIITRENKKYIVDQTLDEIEKIVSPKNFFRINRQFIASIISIGSIHNHFNGKLKLTLKPEVKEEVMVSREKAGVFKDWLDV